MNLHAVVIALGFAVLGSRPPIAGPDELSRQCDTGLGQECSDAIQVYKNILPERALELAAQWCSKLKRCDGYRWVAWEMDSNGDVAGALQTFRTACKAGDRESCAAIGYAQLLGRGTAQSLKQAAEALDGYCQGVTSVADSAIYCLRAARIHRFGLGVPRDPARAETELQAFARHYLSVFAGKANPAVAVGQLDTFVQECRSGSRSSCRSAVRFMGPDRSLESFELMKLGCTADDCWDARLSAEARASAAPDKALEVAEHACNLKPSECQGLGHWYLDGRVVPADSTKAASYLQKACQAGEPESCYEAALIFDQGMGLPRDRAAAARLVAEGKKLDAKRLADWRVKLSEAQARVRAEVPRWRAVAERRAQLEERRREFERSKSNADYQDKMLALEKERLEQAKAAAEAELRRTEDEERRTERAEEARRQEAADEQRAQRNQAALDANLRWNQQVTDIHANARRAAARSAASEPSPRAAARSAPVGVTPSTVSSRLETPGAAAPPSPPPPPDSPPVAAAAPPSSPGNTCGLEPFEASATNSYEFHTVSDGHKTMTYAWKASFDGSAFEIDAPIFSILGDYSHLQRGHLRFRAAACSRAPDTGHVKVVFHGYAPGSTLPTCIASGGDDSALLKFVDGSLAQLWLNTWECQTRPLVLVPITGQSGPLGWYQPVSVASPKLTRKAQPRPASCENVICSDEGWTPWRTTRIAQHGDFDIWANAGKRSHPACCPPLLRVKVVRHRDVDRRVWLKLNYAVEPPEDEGGAREGAFIVDMPADVGSAVVMVERAPPTRTCVFHITGGEVRRWEGDAKPPPNLKYENIETVSSFKLGWNDPWVLQVPCR